MIRSATQRDLEDIVNLGVEFWAESQYSDTHCDVDYGSESFARCIESGICLLAFRDDKPVGFVAGLVSPMFFNPNIKNAVELCMYLLPEHRKSRLGIELMLGFEAEARNRGCNKCVMSLLVESSPEGLATYYIRKGYRHIESSFIKEL